LNGLWVALNNLRVLLKRVTTFDVTSLTLRKVSFTPFHSSLKSGSGRTRTSIILPFWGASSWDLN
jgi:hypothetical protein